MRVTKLVPLVYNKSSPSSNANQTAFEKTRNNGMNNAMDDKIDVGQESNKAATAGANDTPTAFRFLSDERRVQFAKQINGRVLTKHK